MLQAATCARWASSSGRQPNGSASWAQRAPSTRRWPMCSTAARRCCRCDPVSGRALCCLPWVAGFVCCSLRCHVDGSIPNMPTSFVSEKWHHLTPSVAWFVSFPASGAEPVCGRGAAVHARHAHPPGRLRTVSALFSLILLWSRLCCSTPSRCRCLNLSAISESQSAQSLCPITSLSLDLHRSVFDSLPNLSFDLVS